MYRQFFTVLLVCTVAMLAAGDQAFAQRNVFWTKSYGRASSVQTFEVSLTKLDDEYIEPFRTSQEYHTKEHTLGRALWTKTLGAPDFNNGRTVIRISKDGSLIAGYRRTTGSHFEVYLIRMTSSGDTLWSKTFNTMVGGLAAQLEVTGWSLSFSTHGSEVYLLRMTARGARSADHKKSEGGIRTFALGQNYPNPFNPSTTITYFLPKSTFATLKVYNILGREVRTLVNGRQESGRHTINFDATGLASGFYFYRLKAGDFKETKKMLFLK